MKNFLNFYMAEHKLTSITTIELRETWEFFVENMIPDLSAEDVNKILSSIDWETWMYVSGLPPVIADFTTPEGDQSANLALAYIELNGESTPDNFAEYNAYYSNLKTSTRFFPALTGRPGC